MVSVVFVGKRNASPSQSVENGAVEAPRRGQTFTGKAGTVRTFRTAEMECRKSCLSRFREGVEIRCERNARYHPSTNRLQTLPDNSARAESRKRSRKIVSFVIVSSL